MYQQLRDHIQTQNNTALMAYFHFQNLKRCIPIYCKAGVNIFRLVPTLPFQLSPFYLSLNHAFTSSHTYTFYYTIPSPSLIALHVLLLFTTQIFKPQFSRWQSITIKSHGIPTLCTSILAFSCHEMVPTQLTLTPIHKFIKHL